jgi:hypothetical protein
MVVCDKLERLPAVTLSDTVLKCRPRLFYFCRAELF